MHARRPLLATLVGGSLALFALGSCERPEAPPAQKRLVGFELELSPFQSPGSFRVALIEEEPALISPPERDDVELPVLLLDPKSRPKDHALLRQQLGELVRSHGLASMTEHDAGLSFQKAALETDSLHLRIRWSDGARWSSTHPRADLPAELEAFVAATEELAIEFVREQVEGRRASPSDDASPEDEGPRLSLQIRPDGGLVADGTAVELAALEGLLDALRSEGGVVAYSRENQNEDPTEAQMESFKQAVNAISTRGIRIELVELP